MDQVEWDSHLIKAKTKWIIDSEKECKIVFKSIFTWNISWLLINERLYVRFVGIVVNSVR